jgi:hypothetical protein
MEFRVSLVSYPMETAVFFPVLKRLKHEGEHSLSSSAEV